jgi:broad specificity phosphatase PhoE
VTGGSAGFDGLAGAGPTSAPAPPGGIATVPGRAPAATRLVLIRHGEAVCNTSGVCGGRRGCGGLTDRGRRQVEALGDRLARTGELAGTDTLYASVLPRAIQTGELLAPAMVGAGPAPAGGHSRRSAPPVVVTDCGLCELHPGEADGLSWDEFTARFGTVDWDVDPAQPIAPGGESWTGFVNRVSTTLDGVVAGHPGQLVAVACHAGVVEASLLAKLPVAGGLTGTRLQLRTDHASMTTWEIDRGRWRLLRYNDAVHHQASPMERTPTQVQQA